MKKKVKWLISVLATLGCVSCVAGALAGCRSSSSSSGSQQSSPDVTPNEQPSQTETDMVPSIRLDYQEIILEKGASFQVKAKTFLGLDLFENTVKYLCFVKVGENANVASVDVNGSTFTFTALDYGTTVFTISAEIDGFLVTTEIVVTVANSDVVFVIPNLTEQVGNFRADLALLEVGSHSTSITPQIKVYEKNTLINDAVVELVSETPNIARVENNKITALQEGVAVLKGTYKDVNFVITVNVYRPEVQIDEYIELETYKGLGSLSSKIFQGSAIRSVKLNKQEILSSYWCDSEGNLAGCMLNYEAITSAVLGENKTLEINTDVAKYTYTCGVYTQLISNKQELDAFLSIAKRNDNGGYFALDSNIAYEGEYTNNGEVFAGIFDGRGYIIDNFTVSGRNCGLVSRLSGTIRNVSFTNAVLSDEGALIVAHEVSGKVENVYVSVSATGMVFDGHIANSIIAYDGFGVAKFDHIFVEYLNKDGDETAGYPFWRIHPGYGMVNEIYAVGVDKIWTLDGGVAEGADGPTGAYLTKEELKAAKDFSEWQGDFWAIVDGIPLPKSLCELQMVTGITVENKIEKQIYSYTDLDKVKEGLEVTLQSENGAIRVLKASEYTLTGKLSVGESILTLCYGAYSQNITVMVSESSALVKIVAEYQQGEKLIYPESDMDTIKDCIAVWALYQNGDQVLLASGEYVVAGKLSVGESEINITYEGMSANVYVSVDVRPHNFVSVEEPSALVAGAWQQFGSEGAASTMTTYEGMVAGVEGKFWKYTSDGSVRLAFTTARTGQETIKELQAMKALGCNTVTVQLYTEMENLWFVIYGGAYTNWEARWLQEVTKGEWVTIEYSIDDLIRWYTDGAVGLDPGQIPIMGFLNDNAEAGVVYITDFAYDYYVWEGEDDGIFEDANNIKNFKTGGWAEFGGAGANATLEVMSGTVGGKDGTFLQFNPAGSTRAAFTTSRPNAKIAAELVAMKALGYVEVQVQVYSTLAGEPCLWLYGAPTDWTIAMQTELPQNAWMTVSYDIDKLITWYSNNQIGLGANQMPLIGLGNDKASESPVYFTDFIYVGVREPVWDMDNVFESASADNYQAGPWTLFGQSTSNTTLSNYSGTVGGKAGNYVKFAAGTGSRIAFTTNRVNEDIATELAAMKELGYTKVTVNVYVESDATIVHVLYGGEYTDWVAIRYFELTSNAWNKIEFDIDTLLTWYSDDKVGMGDNQIALFGFQNDGGVELNIYLDDMIYLKTDWDTDDIFESTDASNFVTGGWAEFGGVGTGGKVTTYEGVVGGKEGTYLQFNGDGSTRMAFSTARLNSDIATELAAMKELGYVKVEVQAYSTIGNVVEFWLYGAPTNWGIAMSAKLSQNTWVTLSYDIDKLITWYSNDQIGLGAGKMPIVGLGNDSGSTEPIYFTEFKYCKPSEPDWDTDEIFELSDPENFETGAWAEFGQKTTAASLEIYEGSIGGKEGTFLKFNPGGYTRTGFTTTRSNEDIYTELLAMQKLGYNQVFVEVYSTITQETYMVLYGAPTRYEAKKVSLPANTWYSYTYSIKELINWYSNDQIGLGKGQMPLFGLLNDSGSENAIYFTEFTYVLADWDTDEIFESVEVENFTTGGWAEFGGAGATATLEVYKGTIGEVDGTFLQFNTQGATRVGFTTARENADIVDELKAMKKQGYTNVQVQVYSTLSGNPMLWLYGAPTNWTIAMSVALHKNTWVTVSFEIDDLIVWYSNDQIGLGANQMPLIGMGNDAGSTAPVYFSEFIYTCSDEVLYNPTSLTVTLYDTANSTYGFTYNTLGEPKEPYLQYKKQGDTEWKEVALTVSLATSYNRDNEIIEYYIIKGYVKFDPACTYVYRVYDKESGVGTEEITFVTKDLTSDRFTFTHISDTQNVGASGEYFGQILSQVVDGSDFLLHTGDVVEWSKYESEWENMLDGNAEYLTQIPIMAIAGNHDTTYQAGSNETFKHFNNNIPVQSSTENGYFYSFVYGNVKFIMLNTNDLTGTQLKAEQYNWLVNELKNNTCTWTIVSMHNPMYSAGRYGSLSTHNAIAISLQQQLQGIFAEYGVDIVLQGHDHVVSKTFALDGTGSAVAETFKTIDGIEYTVDPSGVIYVMNGAAGVDVRDPIEPVDTEIYDYAYETNVCTWAEFEIDGNVMTVTVKYLDGNTEKTYCSWGIEKMVA